MTASFAAVIGLAGIADLFQSRNLVRPPGAIHGVEFTDSCIKCGACVKACPVRALETAHITDGLQNVGTPALVASDRYCMIFKNLEYPSVTLATAKQVAQIGATWKRTQSTHLTDQELCSKCVDVCPTAALRPTSLDQVHMGTAVVHRDHCLAWLYASCNFACIDACVFDAITIQQGPIVDANLCVGCNQCSYVCIARLGTGETGIMVEATQPKEQ